MPENEQAGVGDKTPAGAADPLAAIPSLAETGATAQPPADGGAPVGGSADAGGKPVRPDWLPADLWDDEKGFKADAYSALAQLQADAQARSAGVPDNADGYQVKLPESFKLPDGFELPQGEVLVDEKDWRIAALRDHAHGRKWSQAEFEQALEMGVQFDIAERKRLAEGVAAEREKLGGRARERIGAVVTFLDGQLGAEAAASLHGMMFSAKQIEAFERLISKMRGDVPGEPGVAGDGEPAAGAIPGYDSMNFRQRMAAIEQQSAGRRA